MEWLRCRDKSILSMCWGEIIEFVKRFRGIRDGGILPTDVLFVESLLERVHNFQKLAGDGTEFLELGEARESSIDSTRLLKCSGLSTPIALLSNGSE